MNMRETMEYIEKISGRGIVFGLGSIKELLRRLGSPQNDLKFIHIAGTNGKGSTLAYLAAVLAKAGYRVGSYSSPAVLDYRERFAINGKKITQKDLCAYMERVKGAADAMWADGLSYPTVFEAETALAFLYMKEKQCALVVLETGMGGALDATNCVTETVAAVFASISKDHMALLGNTLGEIAAQKAGIIKNGCYVISVRQKPDAMEAIRQKCEECGASLCIADAANVKKPVYGIEKQKFSYREWKDIVIHMAGQFQIENAILAIETLQALAKAGYPVSEKDMRTGLAQAQWHGRLSVLAKKPLFLIDGAHNADAAQRLGETVRSLFAGRQVIYMIGVLRDKEYDKMIEAVCREAAHIITLTPPHNERALSAYELALTARECHPLVTAAGSLEEAVEMAYLLADSTSVIIAFGSLSYLGALTEIIKKRKKGAL